MLARAGIASRREIERMIADGRIAIDGKVLDTPATLITSLRGVTVDGNPVEAPAPARLFLFHKPAGVLVTERDPKGRPTIYDRLPRGLPRLVPVGRLDLNTEGLLLLTTDGGLKRQLELPASQVERVYRARAFGKVSQDQLEELIDGVEIDGVRYGRIDANLERRTGANVWIEMRLSEGKNREVRRVLEHLGLKVSRLIRLAYGPFVLGDLEPGQVAEIRRHDIVAFRKTLDLPSDRRMSTPIVGTLVTETAKDTPPRPERPNRAAAFKARQRASGKPTDSKGPTPRTRAARPARPVPKPRRPRKPKA
nr:pseudouridine synthase [Stakelama sediminis]